MDDSDGDGVLTVESEMGTAFFGMVDKRVDTPNAMRKPSEMVSRKVNIGAP